MRNLLFFGLIFLIALSSCKKDDSYQKQNPCGDKFTAYIKSTDLQNCKYKTGSYWVFIDSVNGSFDSISIQSFNQDFIEDYCGNSYETHSYRVFSSYSSINTDYVVVQGGLFKGFDGTANSGTQIYNDYNSTTSMTNYQIEKFDSLFIFDKFYHKVLRVDIGNDPTENHKRSIYYINSEFGFLRQNIYSDSILISKKVLMRKNIIR
jgi:hypothetical protein